MVRPMKKVAEGCWRYFWNTPSIPTGKMSTIPEINLRSNLPSTEKKVRCLHSGSMPRVVQAQLWLQVELFGVTLQFLPFSASTGLRQMSCTHVIYALSKKTTQKILEDEQNKAVSFAKWNRQRQHDKIKAAKNGVKKTNCVAMLLSLGWFVCSLSQLLPVGKTQRAQWKIVPKGVSEAGIPIAGWFICMENPKNGSFETAPFFGNPHIFKTTNYNN